MSADRHNGLPPDHPGRRIAGGLAIAVVLVLILYFTSSELPPANPPGAEVVNANSAPPPPAENRNDNAAAASEPPPATLPPVSEEPVEEPTDPFHVRVQINTLADRQTRWLTIQDTTETQLPAGAEARYTPDNEFTVQTRNVDQFEIDFSSLPVLKGQQIVMHIDDQNLVVHARKQSKLSFARSPAGAWFRKPSD